MYEVLLPCEHEMTLHSENPVLRTVLLRYGGAHDDGYRRL